VGLSERLLRFGLSRPRPLLVCAPGATAVRLATERALRERGWAPAQAAGDADLLVVCGPVSAPVGETVERLWDQMSPPRARAEVDDPAQVARALDGAQHALVDVTAQRADASSRPTGPVAPGGMDHGGMDHGGMDHGGMDHGGMDHGGDGGGHGGHGGHGSMAVMGLAMADRGADRDGLMLDQLHVPLGPVLPDWPAGLVLRLTLQGDVVQDAIADTLPAAADAPTPFWAEPWLDLLAGGDPSRAEAGRRCAAAHLDSLARLLGVAGWGVAATRMRRLRDDLLAGRPPEEVAIRFGPLARRVGSSRLLHAMTRGIGHLRDAGDAAADVQGPALRAGGDVADRLRQWLAEAGAALEEATRPGPLTSLDGPRGPVDAGVGAARALLDTLPPLVSGLDVSSARLVVASLDPDLDELARFTDPAVAP